jgi:hypothetical protein
MTKHRRDKQYLKNMTLPQKRAWTTAIITRMMEAWGFTDKKEIANTLICHDNMPSNWINTGKVPFDVVFTCHLDTGSPLYWLYHCTTPALTQIPTLSDELEEAAYQCLLLGKRTHLISEKNPNGFDAMAKTIVADYISAVAVFTQPITTKADTR